MAGPVGFFIFFPLFLWIFNAKVTFQEDSFALDFHHAFWPAGDAVLHGRSPYPDTASAAVENGIAFLYPPFAALVAAAWALIPREVSEVLYTLTVAGCAFGTLWVLNVRDWRCYASMLLWAPVFADVQSANVSLLMTFALAVVWRNRDRVKPVAAVLGAAIALKAFLWPVLVWLAATRRVRAATGAVAVTAGLSLLGLAAIGTGEVDRFRAVLDRMVDLREAKAYTPYGLLRNAGASSGIAHAVNWALGAGLLAGTVAVARRGRELRSFELALGAALVLSPLVWLHYFVLLLVPVAIKRPRFTMLWLAPVLLRTCPFVGGTVGEQALVLGVAALVLAAPAQPVSLLRRGARRTAPRSPRTTGTGRTESPSSAPLVRGGR